MGVKTTRTLSDRAYGVARQLSALGRDPSEWDVEDLQLIDSLEARVNELRRVAIYGMRAHGVTDKQIGEELGITQQAVSKRWPGGGRYVGAAGRYRTSTQPDRSTP